MSLRVCSLASGSNGNCYYVGNDNDAILVDIGISCRELEKRMKRLSLSIDKIKAVFISHEHTDHISGLASVARKYNLPVYISSSTLSHARMEKAGCTFYNISNAPVLVGALTIQGFQKVHDAADPYSFVISHRGIHAGVFTDLGHVCQNVKKYFTQCHAVFLETNYDREMLMKGSYPWHLKKRISGGKGHISNEQALELFQTHRSPRLTHLFLSHLSKNNNCPTMVQQLFLQHRNNTEIILASRERETPVYHVDGISVQPLIAPPYSVQQGVLEFE